MQKSTRIVNLWSILHTKLLKFAKRSNDINGYTNRKKMEG